MMDTLTMTSSIGTGVAIVNSSLDANGHFDPVARDQLIGSLLTTTISTAIGDTLNAQTMRNIHNKYSYAYVESMSDEELEYALERLNLIEKENPNEYYVKTL